MSWQLYIRSAESILESTTVPSSEEIISLIKRVNPTSLNLSDGDREHGYRIKNRLQNLLLEQYGEAFHLVPHPYSPDIILIKHSALSSIDACHADLNALSQKALETVGAVSFSTGPASPPVKGKPKKEAAPASPHDVLRSAELLLGQYDYPQAEEILASVRITHNKDLPTLLKAAGMLVEELGAYQTAIELLLAQPKQVLREKTVRELMALTYYGNGMIPEARALLDAAHESDLGKKALYAYADISLKDGNLCKAFHLLKLSEQKEGFVTTHVSLRQEIEAAMLAEAEPFLAEAEEAFGRSELALAESLLEKAVSLYPNFQKAHQLAGEIEANNTAAEIKRLWEEHEASGRAEERLDLLAQLLERDQAHTDKIRGLVAAERSGQKREAVDARMAALQESVAKEQWSDCFDILLWLSREGDDEVLRRGCRLAPNLSVLHGNKRLFSLPDQEAKALWLRFLNLRALAQQGQAGDCWELVQDLKQYFQGYPLFKEEYHRALELEQAKTRDEVDRLRNRLDELRGMEETEPGVALAQARTVAAEMRKRLTILPAEESAPHREYAENVISMLRPQSHDDASILDYCEALRLGNLAKAQQLRESWPEGLIKMADEQVAEEFAISAEPMQLLVSPDLVVDLATESAPDGLEYLCASDRHLLFRENDQTLVAINLPRMTAMRYHSPNFEGLVVMDMLPEKDQFLFGSTKDYNNVWRAVLSETESRFTATFQINEHFQYCEKARFLGLFMSASKDNAYYAYIHDQQGGRFVKQTVGLASSVERTFEVAGEPTAAFRLSYQPDRFLIITDSSTAVLESNVTPSRGCSRVGASHTLYYLGIDRGRSEIYALGDGLVNVVNTKLRAVKQYLKAASAAYMMVTEPASICVEKSTALLNINGKGIFFNMANNKFSQKFSLARIVQTQTPSRWYYWDFDAAGPAIVLKDITEEVESLLEWQVLLPAGGDEAAGTEFAAKLEDAAFFSIVNSAAPRES